MNLDIELSVGINMHNRTLSRFKFSNPDLPSKRSTVPTGSTIVLGASAIILMVGDYSRTASGSRSILVVKSRHSFGGSFSAKLTSDSIIAPIALPNHTAASPDAVIHYAGEAIRISPRQ